MISVLFRNREKLLLGWGIIVPLSYLVPKKKNLVLFVEKNQGEFFGNIKFLYLYLHRLKKSNISYYFFTTDRTVYKTLKHNKLPAIFHPSLLSVYILLRANVLVVNDTPWTNKYKYYFLFRSKKVQLWHGVPLKRIKLSLPRQARFNNSPNGRLHNIIRGKHQLYDLFISTSEFFTQNAFSKSFRAKHFLESGYPRNDIFFHDNPDEYDLLGTDEKTISVVSQLRASGYKIVLYAPTYRDTTRDIADDEALNLDNLSEFAKKYKVVFVFKLHSYVSGTYKLEKYDNIIMYDNSKDIQPLLKLSDVLITDYSSVYVDYLLLDRPVIFFPYDYEKYIQKDRDLLFDYDWITPGPKCYSQDELQKTLSDCILGQKDDFVANREEIKNLAFKYKDGNASRRIWDYIKEKYIT